MKAINAIFACMLSVSVPTFAESNFNPSINIDLQTRVSYLNDRIDNHIRHDASGFKGDYFLLSVSGQVTDRLTYSWRQRINQKKERSDRFDGTDMSVLHGTEMTAPTGCISTINSTTTGAWPLESRWLWWADTSTIATQLTYMCLPNSGTTSLRFSSVPVPLTLPPTARTASQRR